MKKQQQFFIFKFSSTRLTKAKFKVEISLNQARTNSELIAINNSELVRALFRYKGVEFSQNSLDFILRMRKRLQKLPNTDENREKMQIFNEKLENMLFIEDLVTVEFENKSHYRAILKNNGFYVNGIRFTPFMASAGMIRRNTALFINNNIKHPLMDILENGRNEKTPVVPAKLGAYFSLYSSSTLPVSFPSFAVVNDVEIQSLRKVDFVSYKGVGEDDDVTEKDVVLKFNAFDGQGLISPRLAEEWSEELNLDYTFSSAVIRAPYLKGLVCVFDFHSFAVEVAKEEYFTDIYGNNVSVWDVDLIISESMFKLYNAYESTQDYIDKCEENGLGFSIAKVNPKVERSYSRTSYQFLQVLNLNDVDIANLCEPTIDWFRNISGGSAMDMLLYATGENMFTEEDFKRMDVITKAILLDPALSRDRYIQDRFSKTVEKRKKESYMGGILINANYQFMIADPYFQAASIFNPDALPLLIEGEYFSNYWNEKRVKQAAAIRSPIVHHSEFNVLTFRNDEKVQKWFSHIKSGIIYPANGIGMDWVRHGGADSDGDLVCTINNSTMIKGMIPSLPIVYESKKAEKGIVDLRNDEVQVEGQLRGHNSKVGFATNISSSLYSLLEEFPAGSEEREIILKRLKIGRVIQGEIIDGVKGLNVPPFREHWTKYTKITEEMTPEEKKKAELNNRLLCEIRPAFFRFLYPHYMTRYNKEIRNFKIFSILLTGKSFEEILESKDKTSEEERIIASYKKNTFFLDNGSVMNKISRYMRTNLSLVGKYSSKSSQEIDYHNLQQQDFECNEYKLILMKNILERYKNYKRGMWRDIDGSFESLEVFIEYLRSECFANISPNAQELADYAIEVTYGGELSMIEFAWKMFPEGIIETLYRKSNGVFKFPVRDDNGEIEYLFNRYTLKEFVVDIRE